MAIKLNNCCMRDLYLVFIWGFFGYSIDQYRITKNDDSSLVFVKISINIDS